VSESAEQRTARRRWLNLAELVAVAGLLIAALTLWLNWSDRREDKAQAAAASAAAARDKLRFELRGKVDDDEILLLRDERHALGDVRVTFPRALGVSPQDAVLQTIEKDWFKDALLRATDGGPDERTGRLPVLVDYEYMVDDTEHRRRAVFDIVWRTDGRPLRGRSLKLVDFRLRQPGGDQAALDAAWSRQMRQPTISSGLKK
jgi:hypothetical protein